MMGALLAIAALVSAAPSAQEVQGDVLEEVRIEQQPGALLPLDAAFRDGDGHAVRLGDLLGERPVLLAFVYYECPRLCGMIQSGLVRALKPLELEVGRDFDVVAVSIAPDETPAQAARIRSRYVELYGRPSAASGWHCLVGDADAVRAVTSAAGFRYVRDAATGEYAHGSAVITVTPDGRISRYLLGVDFAPRDVRLALVEAGEGAIGSLVDAVLLLCYHYDPTTGRYGFAIQSALRAAGILTVALLAGGVWGLARRERRRATAGGGTP
jgi:protein SCO1/2